MCKVELSLPRSILPLLPLIHLTLFSPHGHFPPFRVCDSRSTEQFSSGLWSYCSGYRWLDSEVLTSAIDHGLLWGWVIKNLPSVLFKLQEPLRRALQHVTIPSVVTGKQQSSSSSFTRTSLSGQPPWGGRVRRIPLNPAQLRRCTLELWAGYRMRCPCLSARW